MIDADDEDETFDPELRKLIRATMVMVRECFDIAVAPDAAYHLTETAFEENIIVGTTVLFYVWGDTHDEISVSSDEILLFEDQSGLSFEGVRVSAGMSGLLFYQYLYLRFCAKDDDEGDDEDGDEVVVTGVAS